MATEAKPKGRKKAQEPAAPKEPKSAKEPKVKKEKEPVKVLLRTKDLVEETGVPGTEIRKILRADFYADQVFTRYGWDPENKEDMAELNKIREAIRAHQDGKTEKKVASAEQKTARAATRRTSKKIATAVAEEPTDEELEDEDEFDEFDDEDDEDAEELSDLD